ncbi:ATP-binding protein [Cyanobium gracile]|uniref:ATP-binding protein n=1 Tax=Cyanobium gracile UHCC 0281 TaxID=3110309 RepID=A0ABU5SU82_9CYAN|nr:ATP-binding protein [Cyanobium gracile]MEA5442086.1 ATP-binding protein [Cyanobium gracile UHCC 0281]
MDFLNTRADDAIRRELKGIRDSYHHYWDILAELLQNSRDSITRRRNNGYAGPSFVNIVFSKEENSIKVLDNGTGLSPALVERILAPGGSDKDAQQNEVGEKGVGLTFALFSSNNFFIQSRTTSTPEFAGIVENAKGWLNAEGTHAATRPEYQAVSVTESIGNNYSFENQAYDTSSYCLMVLKGLAPRSNEINIFDLTLPQLVFLLQTKTACGVTTCLHDESTSPEFTVYLEYNVSSSDPPIKIAFPSLYPLPHEMLAPGSVLTLDAALNVFARRGTDEARHRFFWDKVIWAHKEYNQDGWLVKVYGIMLPGNNAFEAISRNPLQLLGESEVFDQDSALFRSTINIATKGMPTGIDISAPTSGHQYPAYYKRCYFVAESDQLPFDMGRKSINHHYRRRFERAVSRLFADLAILARFQQGDARIKPRPSEDTRAAREAQERREWEEALALPDLRFPAISYLKQPGAQEAAVAAVFHELIGAKILTRYQTITTGYSARYDVRALYALGHGEEPLRLVIEFKYKLEKLIDDLREDSKHLMSIHLLVAWDANELKLAEAGFSLDDNCAVGSGSLEGATHLLVIPIEGIEPIPVMLIRQFIDRHNSNAAAAPC